MKKENIDLVEIGKRMKMVRARLRKTQAAMSDDLGISLSHYSKLEVGIGGMSHGLIYTFCNTFNVDQTWFIYGQGEMPKTISAPSPHPGKNSGVISGSDDKNLAKIIELVQDERVLKLTAQIARATQISQLRAMTILIRELLKNPNKLDRGNVDEDEDEDEKSNENSNTNANANENENEDKSEDKKDSQDEDTAVKDSEEPTEN